MCVRTSHVHCPISAKFGTRDLHIIAVERFVNFMEIGATKGRTFFVVCAWGHVFACAVKPCGVLKVKNA